MNTGGVVGEHGEHLLGQVHLDMGGTGTLRTSRRDGDRVLHLLPEFVGDDGLVVAAVELLPGEVADELLVRPHRLLGETAEGAVDLARHEPEFREAGLQLADVLTGGAHRERLGEGGLRDRRHRGVDRDRRRGGDRDVGGDGQGTAVDGGGGRRGVAGVALAAARHPGGHHHHEHGTGGQRRQPPLGLAEILGGEGAAGTTRGCVAPTGKRSLLAARVRSRFAVATAARLALQAAGLRGRIGRRSWSWPRCAVVGPPRIAHHRARQVRARHIAMAAHGSRSGGTGGPASAHVVGVLIGAQGWTNGPGTIPTRAGGAPAGLLSGSGSADRAEVAQLATEGEHLDDDPLDHRQ
jgi:hypothetical protein